MLPTVAEVELEDRGAGKEKMKKKKGEIGGGAAVEHDVDVV